MGVLEERGKGKNIMRGQEAVRREEGGRERGSSHWIDRSLLGTPSLALGSTTEATCQGHGGFSREGDVTSHSVCMSDLELRPQQHWPPDSTGFVPN